MAKNADKGEYIEGEFAFPKFSEASNMTLAKFNRAMQYLLVSGENGYKEPIVAILASDGKTPSANNSWLWDAEATAFRGIFINSRKQKFEFELDKSSNGDWTRSFKLMQ